MPVLHGRYQLNSALLGLPWAGAPPEEEEPLAKSFQTYSALCATLGIHPGPFLSLPPSVTEVERLSEAF